MDWKHPFGRDHGSPGTTVAVSDPDPQAAPLAAGVGFAADGAALGQPDASGDHGASLQAQRQPSGDGPDFSQWVLRPDVSGRLGWEPPNLPEETRWWARSTFDDLPTFGLQARRPGIDPCGWCGRRNWWRSVQWPDVVRCGWCHPPVCGPGIECLNRVGAESK